MLQSLINLFVLKNKAGKPSYSTSMVVYSFAIINLKLLFSGIDILGKVKMSSFSGIDYAAAFTAIAALHVGNKKFNGPKSNEKDET